MPRSIHTSDYARLRAELRRVRTDAGLSQHQLAAILRVPRTWITKVESGERRLDVIEFCWFVTACREDPTNVFGQISARVTAKRATKGSQR
jgi:transcriptional regulator with XRE-family HTH domain